MMFTKFRLLPSKGKACNKSESGTLDDFFGQVHGIADSGAPSVIDKLYHKLAPTWLQLPAIPGKCGCKKRCSDPIQCQQFKPGFNIVEKVWQLSLFAQNVGNYIVRLTAVLHKHDEEIQDLQKRVKYLEGVISQLQQDIQPTPSPSALGEKEMATQKTSNVRDVLINDAGNVKGLQGNGNQVKAGNFDFGSVS